MINKKQNITATMILCIGVMVFIFKPLVVSSQNKNVLDSIISYRAKNITLYESLNEIGSLIGYDFSYNSDLIASGLEVKANYSDITVRNLLTNILQSKILQ